MNTPCRQTFSPTSKHFARCCRSIHVQRTGGLPAVPRVPKPRRQGGQGHAGGAARVAQPRRQGQGVEGAARLVLHTVHARIGEEAPHQPLIVCGIPSPPLPLSPASAGVSLVIIQTHSRHDDAACARLLNIHTMYAGQLRYFLVMLLSPPRVNRRTAI